MSRRNDIVWDLDDTLIHTIFVSKEQANMLKTDPKYSFLKDRSVMKEIIDINDNNEIGTGQVSIALVIFRPGAREIIQYSLENFNNVIIWSAGHKRYVRAIVNILIDPDNPAYRSGRIKVLTRRDCNEITDRSVLKDLKSKGFDLRHVIMVDDNVTTYRNNYDNAVVIQAYNPKPTKEHVECNDRTLYNLMSWFKQTSIHQVPDVRQFDKSKIPGVAKSVSI